MKKPIVSDNLTPHLVEISRRVDSGCTEYVTAMAVYLETLLMMMAPEHRTQFRRNTRAIAKRIVRTK